VQQTYYIHITGIVQGVGFRPFVYQLAKKMGLTGWVNNSSDGVNIVVNGSAQGARQFYTKVLQEAPALATIKQHSLHQTTHISFTDFTIQQSSSNSLHNLHLTPDFALCEACRTEMHQPASRRYHYPFITCTHCGPRYSIATQLPFDRERTTMQVFDICQACREEYNNPNDRRYYAQTNSCADCGITMQLYSNSGQLLKKGNAPVLSEIIHQLEAGSILAVKGIGGYLLLCDATNANSINQLRQRKQRSAKPFAVMFSDIVQAADHAHISKEERQCLEAPVSPVVLLQAKKEAQLPLNVIAPGLGTIGALLPYAPLFEMILHQFGKPVIATSANISGSPIIYQDIDALNNLATIADYIVTHNRIIVTPQDDSVVQYYTGAEEPVILRRSRGMAPSYLRSLPNTTDCILASGALMKSSFTLYINGNLYVSQYLGSTDTLEAQNAYQAALDHVLNMLQAQPTNIITDKHPGYFSHQLTKQMALQRNIAFTEVQHHKAHFAAVLAENELMTSNEPVLGVIWDGTGMGDDGHIWGGEFLKYENGSMLRCYYFDYFPYLLGDKMAKEPRLAALAVCENVMGAEYLLQPKFTATEWALYQKMLSRHDGLQCSSVGRIFDAVASLLHILDKQTYEGEAALYLQTMAEEYMTIHGSEMQESYFMDGAHYYRLPTATLFSGIVRDIHKGKPRECIAAKFHCSLVHIVAIIADNVGATKLAFSGGVFQNTLLVSLLQTRLGQRYQLYFHQQLSPNDENISFGQLQYYAHDVDGIQSQRSAYTNLSKAVTIGT
jgi:hydrogenase maturation protein HypF